jgi:hypothetical protein
MESHPQPSFRPYLSAALTMMILGWGGLALLVFAFTPTVWIRWAFFVCWTLALTGTALPATWFLNLRFPSDPPAEAYVIVRQAIWVGVYGAVLAWLESSSVVSIWISIGLALGLIAIEYIIRMRERSRWRPPTVDDGPKTVDHEPPASNG